MRRQECIGEKVSGRWQPVTRRHSFDIRQQRPFVNPAIGMLDMPTSPPHFPPVL
jgi:hypothetical protein